MVIYPLGKTNPKLGNLLEKTKFSSLVYRAMRYLDKYIPSIDTICSIRSSCGVCIIDKINMDIDNFDYVNGLFVLYLLAKKINKLNK